MTARRKRKVPLDEECLDENYLGEILPGTPEERELQLQDLAELLREMGPNWVRQHRGFILAEARCLVSLGAIELRLKEIQESVQPGAI